MPSWRTEHYCPTTMCAGAEGFLVQWYTDRETAPEPEIDTCPYCGAVMIDNPPAGPEEEEDE